MVRVIDAVAFMDLSAFLEWPQADVVAVVVEDYGYDRDTAQLAVAEAFARRAELDGEDVPSVEDLIVMAHLAGKGDAAIVRRAEAAVGGDELVSNDIVLGLREVLSR